MSDLLDEISEKVVHKEQWNEVKKYMIELQIENKRLNNIINNAIEYIDNSDILDIHYKNRHDLLDILKEE